MAVTPCTWVVCAAALGSSVHSVGALAFGFAEPGRR